MLITVHELLREAETAMTRQPWQLLGEFRTPTPVRSLSNSSFFCRAKMRQRGGGWSFRLMARAED